MEQSDKRSQLNEEETKINNNENENLRANGMDVEEEEKIESIDNTIPKSKNKISKYFLFRWDCC